MWRDYVKDEFNPLMVEWGMTRNMINIRWETEANQDGLLEPNFCTGLRLGNSNRKVDYISFLNDPRFEFFVARAIGTNTTVNLESQTLRKNILEILDLIGKEID